MQKSGTIVHYSSEELRQMRERGDSLTDWARVDAMTEAELEAAIDKEEEGDFEGSVGYPGVAGIKREITLPVDDEVIQWFRLQGADSLDRMNDVLLEYVRNRRSRQSNTQ